MRFELYSSVRLVFGAVAVLVSSICTVGCDTPLHAERTAEPVAASVICLRTEYLPVADGIGVIPFRLHRELGRQAVLIAAREELGVPTRDETIGETFDGVAGIAASIYPEVRLEDKHALKVDLSLSAPSTSAADLTASVEGCSESYNEWVRLEDATARLETEIGARLRESLQEFGFRDRLPTGDKDALPSAEAEKLLSEMSVVSQFLAVRAAHDAIRQSGPSKEWLGVLTRGYAHLAFLTKHHWRSNYEVFAARALLYAERMVRLDSQSDWSRIHRAYVKAILGMHGRALHELREIGADEAQESRLHQPNWAMLIIPYCRFEREGLLAAGKQHKDLRQLVEALSFEQYQIIGDDLWLYASVQRAAEACPQDYGIYAALTEQGKPLALRRMGAISAPTAMSQTLAHRIALIPDLPVQTRKILDTLDSSAEVESDEELANGPFSALPMQIAEALKAPEINGRDCGEPSWSMLGSLIEEEQFVQIANYLNVRLEATETSLAEEVAAVLPLAEKHRYARYLTTYSFNVHRDYGKIQQTIGDMTIVDPRGNMTPMFQRLWGLPDSSGRPGLGGLYGWHAFYGRNVTLPSMLEAIERLSWGYWNRVGEEQLERFVWEIESTSPHAPQVARWKVKLAPKATAEQLQEWKMVAQDDPVLLVTLGNRYLTLNLPQEAIECFQRSINLSPIVDAYIGLAQAHRATGKEELWQPTLERFLKVESLGLEHSQIHQVIAEDLIEKEKWSEAEPHALEVANTWSTPGLALACQVYEGMERWDDSEKWVRELSHSYPTHSGNEWYFWCRRTGRGNVKEARRCAEIYFSADWIHTNQEARWKLVNFHLLEGNPRAALAEVQGLTQLADEKGYDANHKSFCQMHTALLARQLELSVIEQTAVSRIKELNDQVRSTKPEVANVHLAICGLLEGEPISGEARRDFDAKLETLGANNFYFAGRALDLVGEKEAGENWWRQAMRRGPYTATNATLAGDLLSQRYGTSRP